MANYSIMVHNTWMYKFKSTTTQMYFNYNNFGSLVCYKYIMKCPFLYDKLFRKNKGIINYIIVSLI